MSSARAYELCRSAVLVFGLVLAAALTLQGQDSKKREPKRPKLDAGRDTNSAGAYHQHGMLQLAKRPQLAADAFYWAARLDPSIAEPWYGRWCALLLAMQRRDMFALMNDDSRYSKEVTSIDSLRYEALLREPLIYTNLDAVLVRDFFSAVSLATDGEVSEMDLAMVPDPATKAWLAYGSGRFGESVKLYATAINRKPKAKGLHAARARAFIPLLQYDSAAAEFEAERALEQSGRDAYGRALVETLAFYPGHTALARLALATGDSATALKEYDLAAQLAPKRADIRYVYGVLLLTGQRFEEAVEQFQQAVDADPYFVKPYFPLAYLREGQGKDSLAIAYYTQFIALAPAAYARQVEDARQRLSEVKRLFSESH